MDLMKLAEKREPFTKDEIKFIKSKVSKHQFIIKYGFYKRESKSGCQIAFIIDSMNGSRKSGAENNWEIICERELSNDEYIEQIENYGCNRRRFQVFYYRDIGYLIHEDLKYNIETPEAFVKECVKRGYNGDYQTKIQFETN
jgi:hypothetical protein